MLLVSFLKFVDSHVRIRHLAQEHTEPQAVALHTASEETLWAQVHSQILGILEKIEENLS